ncbi:hypothetical protein BH20ACI4_BH20ACI4_20740 [soil metagenome]
MDEKIIVFDRVCYYYENCLQKRRTNKLRKSLLKKSFLILMKNYYKSNNIYIPVCTESPCIKCGKTNICFYTESEKLLFCARSRESPDFEIEGSNWKVFTPVEGWKTLPPKRLKNILQNPPQVLKKASIQIRDIAYRTILELSPVNEVLELTEFLASCGITNPEDYGAMPLKRKLRRKIARHVWLRLQEQFPEFEDIWEMTSIPGFWIKDNHCEFWYKGDFTFYVPADSLS